MSSNLDIRAARARLLTVMAALLVVAEVAAQSGTQEPYSAFPLLFPGRPGRLGPMNAVVANLYPAPDGGGGAPGQGPDLTDDPLDDAVIVLNFTKGTISPTYPFIHEGGCTTLLPDTGLELVAGGGAIEGLLDVSMDFTGDGVADLVTANKTAGTISLLEGVPGGWFLPAVATRLPSDDAPVALCAGDFDGDTVLDVVTAGDGGVTVFLNVNDGRGSFTVPQFGYVPVAQLRDLGVADLKQDGSVDVVTVGGALLNCVLTVLHNDTFGGLFPNSSYPTGGCAASVVMGDLDGDGLPDALVAVQGGSPQGTLESRLEIWTSDSSGGLNSPGVTGASVVPSPGLATWGDLLDVNLDGFLDAVYLSGGPVFLPQVTADQFQPPVSLTVLLGDGMGGWSSESEFELPFSGKAQTPMLADISSSLGGGAPDGYPDVTVVWQQNLFAPDGTTLPGDAHIETFIALLVNDTTGNFSYPCAPLSSTLAGPGNGAAGDLDGDAALPGGGIDLVVPSASGNALAVHFGLGDGQFVSPEGVPGIDSMSYGTFAPLPVPQVWVGGPREALVRDLDGDFLPDVVVDNEWTPSAGIRASTPTYSSVTTLRGTGGGQFAKVQNLLLPAGGDIAVARVTGTAAPDLLAAVSHGMNATHALHVFAGAGNATFSSPAIVVPAPAGLLLSGGLVAADVELDGDVDALSTGRSGTSGRLVLFRNAGGVLTAQDAATLGSWSRVQSLDAGDLTGDGLPEVVVGLEDGHLLAAMNSGAGLFAPLPIAGVAGTQGGGALRLADVDVDGRLDLVSCTSFLDASALISMTRVLTGDGAGGFAVHAVPGLACEGTFGAARPIVADFDGNGRPDLALAQAGTESIAVLLNAWDVYGTGKAGSGGFVPQLTGSGSTGPEQTLTLHLSAAKGGAPALLQFGLAPEPPGSLLALVPGQIALELMLVLPGSSPGGGAFDFAGMVPDDAAFVGLDVYTQVLVKDAGAGAPHAGFAWSNGLAFTFTP